MALPPDAYSAVCSLFATGLSDRAISRQTGEAQASVSRWRRSPSPPTTVVRAEMDAAWGITDPRSYCYLLGAHLGDGTVYHQAPGFWGLRIVNDRQYQRISEEIRAAMSASFPGGSVRTWPSFIGESDILHASHPAIPRAFPQHGPGRKHTRTIELADWQLALTRAHPGALVRGLVHSDGCRSRNSFTTKLPSARVLRTCGTSSPTTRSISEPWR
jgi:hypothetical protein